MQGGAARREDAFSKAFRQDAAARRPTVEEFEQARKKARRNPAASRAARSTRLVSAASAVPWCHVPVPLSTARVDSDRHPPTMHDSRAQWGARLEVVLMRKLQLRSSPHSPTGLLGALGCSPHPVQAQETRRRAPRRPASTEHAAGCSCRSSRNAKVVKPAVVGGATRVPGRRRGRDHAGNAGWSRSSRGIRGARRAGRLGSTDTAAGSPTDPCGTDLDCGASTTSVSTQGHGYVVGGVLTIPTGDDTRRARHRCIQHRGLREPALHAAGLRPFGNVGVRFNGAHRPSACPSGRVGLPMLGVAILLTMAQRLELVGELDTKGSGSMAPTTNSGCSAESTGPCSTADSARGPRRGSSERAPDAQIIVGYAARF